VSSLHILDIIPARGVDVIDVGMVECGTGLVLEVGVRLVGHGDITRFESVVCEVLEDGSWRLLVSESGVSSGVSQDDADSGVRWEASRGV